MAMIIFMTATGRDALTGGEGAEKFFFRSYSGPRTQKADAIDDLVPGTDLIDLSTVDANNTTEGHDPWEVVNWDVELATPDMLTVEDFIF